MRVWKEEDAVGLFAGTHSGCQEERVVVELG